MKQCMSHNPCHNKRLRGQFKSTWEQALRYSSVPDLNNGATGLAVLLKVDVNGKMGVDVAHLVFEAFGDTDHQVVEDRADGTEGSNGLAVTVVDLDLDDVLLGALERNGQVGQILDQLACVPRKRTLSVFRVISSLRCGLFIWAHDMGSVRFQVRSKIEEKGDRVPLGPSTVTTRERM